MNDRVSAMETSAADELERPADVASAEGEGATHFQGLNGQSIKDEATTLLDDLRRFDLLEHVAELQIMGLTVIPPEKVGLTDDLIDTVREKLLDVCEERKGIRPDWIGNMTHGNAATPFGELISWLALEDPVFQKVMLNEVILTMVNEQLGRNAVLSGYQALIKPRGGNPLDLHIDDLIVPAPLATHTGSINVTIPLTDYTIEAGPLAYVPGSHKYMRPPVGREGWDQRVPVTAKRGSVIIWPGSTWHGAFTGTAPGLRMNLIIVYARPHMRTLEDYNGHVTQTHLDQNPPRFAKLMGQNLSYGWKKEGPVLDGSETLIGSTAFN